MSTRKLRFLYLFTVLVLVSACVPAFAQPFPTIDPNAVGTFIALTANAASTQTAAAQPTFTPTPTITPTRLTDTPSPTTTATVVFILSTPTQPVFPTFTLVSGVGSGATSTSTTSSANFSCQVLSVSPTNGSTFDPRDDFDATWRVRNNGQRTWDRNSVDFIYDSGAKIHKVSGYDLDANVRTGETTNLGVDIEVPRDPGTYTTTWTLRVGNDEFCKMSLTIVVR